MDRRRSVGRSLGCCVCVCVVPEKVCLRVFVRVAHILLLKYVAV
jgi:hypothetical protein